MNPSKITSCPILYDDGGLLVIHKPAGVLSHPNPKSSSGRAAFEGPYDFERRCFQTSEGPLWLIHRLDQDTSGILVAARTEAAAAKCREQFEKGEVLKIYSALVVGQVRPPRGNWNDYLVTDKKGHGVRSRVIPASHANARLHYALEKYFPKYRLSLLTLELVTGKTHQIRVQAAYRSYPVAGDDIYGNFSFNRKLRKEIGLGRIFLHAGVLEIGHPVSGKKIRIEAPLAAELGKVLARLG